MTIVWGILGLGFLVFFHELGHFVVARLCGVTVEAFSIGMGPVLLHHKWGHTDYRISLIPLGGYCAMKGEKDYQKALDEEKKQIDGDKDSFYGVPAYRRLLIAFAGPFFNFLFATIAFTVIALMGYKYYSAGTTVQMTVDTKEFSTVPSAAKEAGLESGDTILSIDGKAMNDFSDIALYVSTHGGDTVRIKVLRNGQELEYDVSVTLDKDSGAGKLGIVNDPDSVVQRNYGPYSFFPAIAEGTKQTVSMVGLTCRGIATLFKGVDVTKAVSGPARITTMLGSTVKEGFSHGFRTGVISTLQFLALISVSLFLTNLLPVPILDGGLILFALIEIITRRKMNPKVLYYIQFVGIAFIVFMFILAIVGDLRYFIFKGK